MNSYLKGFIGEFLNRLGHRFLLSKKHYHSFHNIVIPSRGGTTEIDHLLVSKFGIFVVETKYWSGWIFGSERERTWTRVHFRSKRQIPNPLYQNYGHVMALSELLGIPPDRIRALVAIRGAYFKTSIPHGVVVGGYASHIRRIREVALEDTEIDRMLEVLRSDRVGRSWIARIRHAWWTVNRPSPFAVVGAQNQEHGINTTSELVVDGVDDSRLDEPPVRNGAEAPAAKPTGSAFCIGCGDPRPFDGTKPMCLSCSGSSKSGTDLSQLPRRTCHVCGWPSPQTLAKPICPDCWKALPIDVQKQLSAALR